MAVLPQLIVWKIIYGNYILKPYSNSSFTNLTDPSIFKFLFSTHYGMFFWTPAYFLAIAGLIIFLRDNFIRRHYYWFLFGALFLVQVYINSAISDWWGGGGGSFGARRMLDFSLIYILGLAYLFKKISNIKIARICLGTVMLLLTFTNVSLMIQAARGWLDQLNPYSHNYNIAVPSVSDFILNSKRIIREFLKT